MLSYYDNKPDPLWMGGITLNTAVSIASALFRVALMYSVTTCISQLVWVWFSGQDRPLGHTILFDQASRGPWGSLMILFSSAAGYVHYVAQLHMADFAYDVQQFNSVTWCRHHHCGACCRSLLPAECILL